jgi:gliding motility-associated protein GldM
MGTKNCPETPRQKMINMMYLVLTALLALNIAAETLNAFKVVDLSLTKTYETFTNKNKSVINDFEWEIQNGQSPDTARFYLAKAQEVRQISDTLVSHIHDLKVELATLIKAKPLEPGEKLPEQYPYIVTKTYDTLVIKNQEELNVSPLLMIERGKGEELRNKIIDLRTQLIGYANGNKAIEKSLMEALDVSDPERRDATTNARTWVQLNFYQTPMIAAVTILSKLQNDIRIAEDVVLKHLYSNIASNTQKVRSFEAKVIPKSTYVIAQNQRFEAQIFLAAITDIPVQVFMTGSNTPLPVVGNQAIYSASPQTPGKYSYSGEIRFADPFGNLTSSPFKGEYEVALPAATISPSKMNVFYRGIDNPVEISVPGVSNNNIRVSMTNGNITQSGNEWLVRPTTLQNAKIDVIAMIDGREIPMGSKLFRVKDVPPPKASLGGITSGNVPREYFRTQTLLSASLEDFLFELEYQITGFDISIATGGGMTTTFSSNSENFTADQRNLLNGLRKGDRVIFENIRARIKGSNVVTNVPLSPTIFNVN